MEEGNLVKVCSRGAALPGMLPNPDHESLWPMTKFHAQHWPLVLRQVDSTRSKSTPVKIQIMDIVRWENVTVLVDALRDQKKVLGVL